MRAAAVSEKEIGRMEEKVGNDWGDAGMKAMKVEEYCNGI